MTADEENTTEDGQGHDGSQSGAKLGAKPTRRAKVMRGIIAPIFGLLAVTAIAFGLLNATIWKPNPSVTATGYPSSRYVVTDPGVLSLLDGDVNLQVGLSGAAPADAKQSTSNKTDKSTAADSRGSNEICVAIGQSKDVAGWLAGSKYDRIIGLRNWTNLHTQTAEGSSDSSSTVAKSNGSGSKNSGTSDTARAGGDVTLKHSDMWSQVSCVNSARTVKMNVKAGSSQVALIDFGKNLSGQAEQVSMHWVRSKVPNTAIPFYITAAVLAVITVLCASILAMEPKRRKKREGEGGQTGQIPEVEVTIGEALTGSLQGLGRNLRVSSPGRHSKQTLEAEAASEAAALQGLQSARELKAEGPSIVDPSLHNLVDHADEAASEAGGLQDAGSAKNGESVGDGSSTGLNGNNEDIELTSIISDADFSDYLARFSQEETQEKVETPDGSPVSEDGETPDGSGDDGVYQGAGESVDTPEDTNTDEAKVGQIASPKGEVDGDRDSGADSSPEDADRAEGADDAAQGETNVKHEDA